MFLLPNKIKYRKSWYHYCTSCCNIRTATENAKNWTGSLTQWLTASSLFTEHDRFYSFFQSTNSKIIWKYLVFLVSRDLGECNHAKNRFFEHFAPLLFPWIESQFLFYILKHFKATGGGRKCRNQIKFKHLSKCYQTCTFLTGWRW